VTWRQLSHPNVLPFYGVFHLNNNRSRVCLVSPWMENGNIIQFLKKNPEVDRIPLVSEGNKRA
jgi:serine/threonine protein kinase